MKWGCTDVSQAPSFLHPSIQFWPATVIISVFGFPANKLHPLGHVQFRWQRLVSHSFIPQPPVVQGRNPIVETCGVARFICYFSKQNKTHHRPTPAVVVVRRPAIIFTSISILSEIYTIPRHEDFFGVSCLTSKLLYLVVALNGQGTGRAGLSREADAEGPRQMQHGNGGSQEHMVAEIGQTPTDARTNGIL